MIQMHAVISCRKWINMVSNEVTLIIGVIAVFVVPGAQGTSDAIVDVFFTPSSTHAS